MVKPWYKREASAELTLAVAIWFCGVSYVLLLLVMKVPS